LTNQTVIFNAGATITQNPTNTLIFRAAGTLAGSGGANPTTNVVWDFNLTGGAAAILDIANGNSVLRADNTTGKPVNAISITAPETVQIDPSSGGLNLQQDGPTLIAPLVYVVNSSLSGIITNITQRQAYLVEESKATLPTSFLGGTGTNKLYFVGRNNSAAVKQVFDASIFFVDTAYNYTTNLSGLPVLGSGDSSGTQVAADVKAITNSIGTVAAQDINGLPVLSYEGVTFSTNNVINGSYPIWGYERYIYFKSPDSRAPSPNQLLLIKALENAVSDSNYDHTNSLFKGKFVSFADIDGTVYRDPSVDGSLILPGHLPLPIQ
jgi:hypothetical protein